MTPWKPCGGCYDRDMRTSHRLTLAAACLASHLPATAAGAETGIRLERVSGAPVEAQRLTSIDDAGVALGTDAGHVTVPLADVIEIGFATPPDPPRSWQPADVAVDLASGETIHGRIESGDSRGVTIASPLLGSVTIKIERISAVRFLLRLAQMPEPPDLRAAETTDVVHLTGSDRLACTLEAFAAKSLAVESASGEKVVVAYDRVTALRVLGDAPKRPLGTLLVAVLRDGSQIIGSSPVTKDGHLLMKGVSGFAIDAALTDVVAAHVVSDRFSYLSDLAPAKLEVTPFWSTVAGDPAVLYAPRMDRSFTGRTLTSGGRTWVKGLGVYSGTSMTYALDGKYAEFRSAAGIDDGAGPLGSVVFEVIVDGATKWTSGFVRSAAATGRGKGSPIEVPRIDLKGAKSLTLRVVAGDADDPWPVADQADWLGAMLVR